MFKSATFLLFLLLIFLTLFSCSKNTLPKTFSSPTEFSNNSTFLEPPIIIGSHEEYILIMVPVSGKTSYSSANNHLGLYRNNKLAEEIVLGSIPLELVSWDKKEIRLKVIGQHSNEYLDNWLVPLNNSSLGPYKIIFSR